MRRLRCTLVCFLICVVSVFADSMAINLENDCFALPKTDDNYSHGTEIVYTADSPLWVFDNWDLGLEQTMYTPPLIKTDALQLGEHPYCGYLSLNFIGEQWFKSSESTELTLQHQLGFGTVGPHAHSEQSQKTIHKWLGCKEPKGWKWQIANEAIVQYQLCANLNWRFYGSENGFSALLIPRATIDVGGFKDMIAVGTDLKLGWRVPKNVGSNMILSMPSWRGSNKFSCFTLVGAEGRCVLHDTSIDGGFFRDSIHTEESETWVGELHWGLGLSYSAVEIDYFVFTRSNELENSNATRPNYGRVSLKVSF